MMRTIMYNPARFLQEEQRNRARIILNASYLLILWIIDNIQEDQRLEADLLMLLDEIEQANSMRMGGSGVECE